MVSVMSKAGEYAGGEDARNLFDRLDIAPEMRSDDDGVCTIGWSERESKWYGWSHRGYQGYGIGDEFFDGKHKIETDRQARIEASNFSEDVS